MSKLLPQAPFLPVRKSGIMTLDVASAKRLVLGPVLLYVLWLLAKSLFSFGAMVTRQHQEQQDTLRTLERSEKRQLTLLRQNRENIGRQRPETATRHAEPRTIGSQTARRKLTASALVSRLRKVNAFGLAAQPERRLHCSDSRGDWDYTCLFHPDPITNANWVQFGVLVDDAHVIEMSETYPPNAPLPQPLSVMSK